MKKNYPHFVVSGNQIIIKDHVLKAKPITGTKLAAITKDNCFTTPFVAFMDMYRFTLPFKETIQMIKGREYEPLVIAKVNSITNNNFGNYSSHNYYDWPLEKLGLIYNGKIDGWEPSKKIILECKVTKIDNLYKWINNNPPQYYLLQMLLYAKMAQAQEMWLVGYFLESSDYEKNIINQVHEKRLKIWKFNFNQKTQKFLDNKLKIAQKFMQEHIQKRISPPFDITKQCDRELLDHLGIEY